jgi:hypothetical protein
MENDAREGRLLLLADDPGAVRAVANAAQQLPCRVLATPVGQAAERLADGDFDAVFVHLGESELERHGALLDLLDREPGRFRWALQVPAAAIARVAAIGLGPNRRLAAAAGPEELLEILGWLMEHQPDQLHGSDKGTSRLLQLSQDAERLAGELAALSELAAPRDDAEDRPFDAARVRAIIRARRLRDQFFGPNLFADPAWDMLLDLMAARLEGQHVAVSSLCIAAAVPATTALRWIKVLTDQGLLLRVADPQDGRRIHIELSDQAAAALDAYLRTAQRISSTPG